MKDLNELNVSPAPWEYEDESNDIICHLENGIRFQVATPYIHMNSDITEANANLIKEAPNLYKYLREAYLHMIGKHDFNGTEAMRWKAVLDAAAGETSEE